MADLIALQTQHHSFLSPSKMIPRHAHKRSLSSGPRSLSPEKTISKAKSTNNLADAVSQGGILEESNFNTLQDPRLVAGAEISHSEPSQSHHPDLSSEVAALSVKLVQAINNQTTLDDNLVATRQDLEQAQAKITALEFQNEKYRRDIDEQVYIKKSDADREIFQLKATLADERAQRAVVEKAKKSIEQELETLTQALFEEANKMVAAAKLEREAVEKKNDQLRCQIKDTESLLVSQQDQLAELKSVMQGMNLSKDDVDARTSTSTAPPSPANPAHVQGSAKQEPELDHVPAAPCNPEQITPGPSASFPQWIRMVCRTDLQAYEDFRELLALSRSSKPSSRAASGSYAGLHVMSLASFGSTGSASSSPTKGVTHSPNASMSSQTCSSVPLKETRFYKRVLLEDVEPTLRLDAAPGISWLTRRTVLSGICEGSLVVEPMPTLARKFEFPCTVCGERRPGAQNERTHRFRTSDSETAQRYALCPVCLGRVRSCCEITGYLRLILDGHIRTEDAEEEKEIWEETVRLRERMFWSRIGGGIVPLFSRPNEPESVPATTETQANGNQIHQDKQQPQVPDNSTLDLETKEGFAAGGPVQFVTEAFVTDSPATDPGMTRSEVSEPPKSDHEVDGYSHQMESKRTSMNSGIGVYDEANGVATEAAASVPEQSSTGLDEETTEVVSQSNSRVPN